MRSRPEVNGELSGDRRIARVAYRARLSCRRSKHRRRARIRTRTTRAGQARRARCTRTARCTRRRVALLHAEALARMVRARHAHLLPPLPPRAFVGREKFQQTFLLESRACERARATNHSAGRGPARAVRATFIFRMLPKIFGPYVLPNFPRSNVVRLENYLGAQKVYRERPGLLSQLRAAAGL